MGKGKVNNGGIKFNGLLAGQFLARDVAEASGKYLFDISVNINKSLGMQNGGQFTHSSIAVMREQIDNYLELLAKDSSEDGLDQFYEKN